MATKVDPAALQAGDILLYHGDGFISDLIRLFDGSEYSHASIYDGNSIVEALGDGIAVNTVAQSAAGAKYVDVYRFRKTGQALGSVTYPLAPLATRIQFYVDNRQRYAYEQILLLAVIASTRRIPAPSWIPGLAMVLRSVFDNAGEFLARITSAGKEPVICSELVYRCYAEARPDRHYSLDIVGADVLAPAFAAAAVDPAAVLSSPAVDGLASERTVFLNRYAAAKGQSLSMLAAAGFTNASNLAAAAVADFVTPRDLSQSPDLQKIGGLNI
jgi:hypothetical protein